MGKRTIIFRADGGPAIGMGHFIRTLALAEMLQDDFYCIYATQSPTEYQINEIKTVCHNRIDLPADETHFNVFLDLLEGDEIVVLDNYFFTTEYQNCIKQKGCKLVCIDDLHDKKFVADLIINHAPVVEPSDYDAMPYTLYALGLKFILIRPAFLNQAQKQRKIKNIDTILICFGGSDPLNLTKSVLQVVLKFEKFKKIILITGAANQAVNVLSELAEKDSRIEHKHSLNQQQMLETMLQADLAIVPTSGILFELMSVGVAVITGYFAKNQQEASFNFSSLQLAFNLGSLNEKLYEKLYDQINAITVENSQKMIDNQKNTIKNSKCSFVDIFKKI